MINDVTSVVQKRVLVASAGKECHERLAIIAHLGLTLCEFTLASISIKSIGRVGEHPPLAEVHPSLSLT